jgi:hypothetical protein
MKLFAIASVFALAPLASPTHAQGIPLEHMSMEALDAAVGRVFSLPGTSGDGFGSWVGPTGAAAGSVEGMLVDANGEAAWQLDASLTRYVAYGLGIEFGGLYGTLYAVGTGDDLPTAPTLVQGEWLRLHGDHGRFAGVAFQPAPFPQNVRVVGALRGDIRYDEAIALAAPAPAPATRADYAGTAAAADRVQDDMFDLSARGNGGGPTIKIERAPKHKDMNDRQIENPAHLPGLGGSTGGAGGSGGGSQSGAVSVAPLRDLTTGLTLDRGPAFTISISNAEPAASLRDRFADSVVPKPHRGGNGPIAATGTFDVAYRMLD